jgi:hypothetical protein
MRTESPKIIPVEITLDARRRLPLGKLGLPDVNRYSLVQKQDGTIILTPVVSIPRWEAELLRDSGFRRNMEVSLREVHEGRTTML